uniref:Uncharacterized protein n=1 Tax=Sphaerodactylus townsendi TaxID=933632 RepID=A0ACB8E643_9SAUR
MFSGGEQSVGESADNGHPVPVDLTGTSDTASDPSAGDRSPQDGSEGVTVRHRQGQGQRDSQPPDLSSALWATVPLAGNVLFGDHSAGDIAASEAKAWRLLQTMEGAWWAERDDYSRALRLMEQDVEQLHTALAQARHEQAIPDQAAPPAEGAPPVPPPAPAPALQVPLVPPAPVPPVPAPPVPPMPAPPAPGQPVPVPVGAPVPPAQPAALLVLPLIQPLHPPGWWPLGGVPLNMTP